MARCFDELFEHAARRHGLFTVNDAACFGVEPWTISGWLRRGIVVRVHRGVYRVAGAPDTWCARVLGASIAAGGVASHRSAARLHGLGGFTSDAVDISVPSTSGFRPKGVRIHRRSDFDLIDAELLDGIPTTRVDRLLVDVGASVSPYRLGRILDQALVEKRLDLDTALQSLVRHARRGRNGVGALRAVLDERFGTEAADSMLELDFIRLVGRSGLPLPEPQVEVYDEDGFVMRLDYGYVDRRVGAELDSVSHHLDRETFEADRAKRNRARLAGWSVLEFTDRMIKREPTRVCTDLARALGA